MSTYSWPSSGGSGSGGGGGVPAYYNFASLPTTAPDGQLAVTLNDDSLYVFDGATATWLPIGTPSSFVSIGAIDTQTASVNGAVISATSLYMQSASATRPGLVNIAAQTFAGVKTFSSAAKSINFVSGISSVASAAGTTVLTATSNRFQALTGVTTQTYQLPDATTLTAGTIFEFDNNSTGVLTVVDNSSGAVATVPAGGYGVVIATDVSGSNGTWDKHFLMPANAAYGTAGLTVTGAIVASGTVTCSNFSGSNTGDVTLAAFGSAPSANAASLSGQVLTIQPADGTHPGGVSIAAQTFAGVKTFSSSPVITSITSSTGTLTVNTSGAITVPSATDTLVGKATTDTLTNKTISTGGTNVLGATTISGVTGSGNVVFSASPTLTGTIGAAAATFSSTVGVTGVATFTAQPIMSSLSVSQAVFSDGSKGLVSNAITGTGNVVMSASPTLTGTLAAAAGTFSTTLGVTGVATFTAQPIVSSLSVSQAVFSDGSKGLVSNAITGTGNVVMSASPTLTGTIGAAAGTFSSTLGVTGLITADGGIKINGGSFGAGRSYLSATAGRIDVGINGSAADWTLLNSSGLTVAQNPGGTGAATIHFLLADLAGTGSRAVVADSGGQLSAPVSDSRLKKDIVPIQAQFDPISAVQSLSGILFHWDTEKERVKNHGPQQEIGMIAQDVEKIVPQAVREDHEGWKSMDYSALVPLLIEAIKQQQKQIDSLMGK